MIQVWKCDFCNETNADAEVTANHEKGCSFNPATKRCWTCTHRTTEGAPISGFWNGCSVGVSSETQEDLDDTGGACPRWEPVEKPEDVTCKQCLARMQK